MKWYKYGSHVHLLVRRNLMRASKIMQHRVLENDKITVHWQTEVVDVYGKDVAEPRDESLIPHTPHTPHTNSSHKYATAGKSRLEGVEVRNSQTGEHKNLPVGGLFYAIGHTPNTQIFQGQLELDEVGYVVTQEIVKTSVPGVYAVGDVQDYEFRQAITAAGSGCMGAMLAEKWLSSKGLAQELAPEKNVEKSPEEYENGLVADTVESFDPNATHHLGGYALRRLYHQSDRLIVVKYSAPTCAPCHTLKPILEKVIQEFEEKIHYVEIDIEEDPEITQNAGVMSTPTIQFFKDKGLVKQLKGMKRKSEYRKVIQSNVG